MGLKKFVLALSLLAGGYGGQAYAQEPANFATLKQRILESLLEAHRDPAMCSTVLGPEVEIEELQVDGKNPRRVTTTCLDTNSVCAALLHPTLDLTTRPDCYPIPPSIRIDAR